MKNLNINKTGCVFGIISLLFFFVCTLWGGVISNPALKELHFALVQIAYPGFAFTLAGYLIGLLEAFVYGWVIGALFAWLCKKLCVSNCKHCNN